MKYLKQAVLESDTPLHSFAVCSDNDVGKKRKAVDDIVQTFTHELRYPATTNAARLAEEMAKRDDSQHMSVVFSTYYSIEVISAAQKQHQLPDFDLIICDEAHRTTGATFDDEGESNFIKVHDADFIKATKRLYMTATPRIYGNAAKATAEQGNIALCSMDDETLFGQELYVISFSEAVKQDLLVDYKVIVLAIDEFHVSPNACKNCWPPTTTNSKWMMPPKLSVAGKPYQNKNQTTISKMTAPPCAAPSPFVR